MEGASYSAAHASVKDGARGMSRPSREPGAAPPAAERPVGAAGIHARRRRQYAGISGEYLKPTPNCICSGFSTALEYPMSSAHSFVP